MKIKRFSYILNTATLHTFHFKKQNTQKKAIHTQVPSVEKCERFFAWNYPHMNFLCELCQVWALIRKGYISKSTLIRILRVFTLEVNQLPLPNTFIHCVYQIKLFNFQHFSSQNIFINNLLEICLIYYLRVCVCVLFIHLCCKMKMHSPWKIIFGFSPCNINIYKI